MGRGTHRGFITYEELSKSLGKRNLSDENLSQAFIHILDEKIVSCAGGFAGVDMMLQIISDHHGPRLSGEIADQMVYYPVRPGHNPQRRILGRGSENLLPVVSKAIEFIEKNISEPPTIPEISTFVGLSQRQLERQFKKSIGCSVVQFALLARLQYSRVLLIATDLTVREIATASGFNTLSHFAYAFKNCFNRKPSAYRQAWPDTESAPSWPGTLSNYLETLDSKTRNTKRARNNDSYKT